jgi:hypothetical protein
MTEQEKAEKKRAYMREYARKRRASDPAFLEKNREAGRKSREKNRDLANKRAADWKAANKEKVAAYAKEYVKNNKELLKSKRTERALIKKEQYSIVSKAWREKNKDSIKEWNRIYTANRYKTDPVFALKINQRSRVRAILKSNKSAKTNELLGCTFEELKEHIQRQFVDGMSWDNMGEWHIDHIVPLAAFDLTKEENQKLAFHYTNLQPLWAIDNLKKGAKHG